MKIGQRIFLCVLPALLGVAALTEMSRHDSMVRAIPHAMILVPLITVLASITVAWWNTRYITRMLRGARRQSKPPIGVARDGDVVTNATMVTSATEYDRIVTDMMNTITQNLEEAELPLHVLLASPFGSLNENQEEMLAAARDAVAVADSEVRRFKTLLELDRDGIQLSPKPMRLSELLRPALAVAGARAHVLHVSLRSQISETAPRAIVDPGHTQMALTAILLDAVSSTTGADEVILDAGESDAGALRIIVSHGVSSLRVGDSLNPISLAMRVAIRLITLQHGSLAQEGARTVIELPGEVLSPTTGIC